MRTLALMLLVGSCFGQVPLGTQQPYYGGAGNGPFSPKAISGLAYAWLGADAASAANSSGILTGGWNDEIQNLPSNQGSMIATEWVANGGVWFSGAGGISNATITEPNVCSVVMVVHPIINTVRESFLLGDGGSNHGLFIDSGGHITWSSLGGTFSSALASDLNYTIIQTIDNGNVDGAIYTNGVLSANGAFSVLPLHDFGNCANGHALEGWIFAVLVYTNKIITAGDIANLQTWSTATYPNPPVTPPWAPGNVKGLVYWVNPTNSVLVNTNNQLCSEGSNVWYMRTVASENQLTANGSIVTPANGPVVRLTGAGNSQAMFGCTNTSWTYANNSKSWAQTNWYFSVVNVLVDGTDDSLIDGLSGHENQIILENGAQYYIFGGTSTLAVPIAWPFDGHYILHTAIFNGANSEIRTNTISAKTGSTGTQDMILSQVGGVTFTYTYNLAEILVYNSAAGFSGSSQDVWTVSNYLTNKFKIGPGI